MEVLLLRFDAPLMSFGGVVVDQNNPTDRFPYRAMLTGLFANALGLDRREAAAHNALQSRIRYAARTDRPGSLLMDYQTVSFDDDGPMASGLGWTTRGELEERKGGGASDGTHIRFRHYLADAILTVATTLEPAAERPSISDLASALSHPARPLFLGRKCCIPSGPLLLRVAQAPSLVDALAVEPRVGPLRPGEQPRGEPARPLAAIWPRTEGFDETRARLWPRVEDRDWHNSIHVGRRIHVEGLVDPPAWSTEQSSPLNEELS